MQRCIIWNSKHSDLKIMLDFSFCHFSELSNLFWLSFLSIHLFQVILERLSCVSLQIVHICVLVGILCDLRVRADYDDSVLRDSSFHGHIILESLAICASLQIQNIDDDSVIL